MTQPAASRPFLLPSWLRQRPSFRDIVFAVAILGVIALHSIVFFVSLFESPIGFDEGFILQAPLNLVQGNGYSTEDWDWRNNGENLNFDAIVSTGPIVLMPVALSFLLFGVSIVSARIVMVVFYGILLGSLFVLGRRIGGRWVGLAAMAVVLALDTRVDWPTTFIFGPSDVLGEFAAAAMIALALVLLPRHRRLSGLIIGLAVLAKFIAFMAVPAFMLALLIVPAVTASGGVSRWRARIAELVQFAIAVLIPSIAWEIVKLVSIGPGPYLDSLISYARFVFRSGSGVDGTGSAALFVERLARLFAAWHLPTLIAGILALALFALALLGLRRYFPLRFAESWADNPSGGSRIAVLWRRFLVAARRIPVDLWAAAATLGAISVWWTFIASSNFVRHTMPVLLVAIPLVVALAFAGAVVLWRDGRVFPRVVAVVSMLAIVATIALQGTLTMRQASVAPEWTRAQQVEAAEFVRSLGVDEVQGIGWWASPEVRFLSNVPSTPIGTGTGPLVLSPILRTLDPGLYETALDYCEETLYENEGFVICEVSPDTEPMVPLDPEERAEFERKAFEERLRLQQEGSQ